MCSTGHHVVTDIKAYHADGKDSQCLRDICDRLEKRLHKQGLLWHDCIADTGYSSGENYAFLERKGTVQLYPAPRYLQRWSGRVWVSQREGLLHLSTGKNHSL
ncbi:transposase [Flavivirga rizhaonensis]|uniref:transposase n=1 Tax=Flavivirga rizhaonensis TaxID=2559571 RepID=UPI002938DEA2|nr:transposase [Flavivirga rizhaonensis]